MNGPTPTNDMWTLTTEGRVDAYLRSRGITASAQAFTELVSNIWHGFESQHFDRVHDEITETAGRWQACLSRIAPDLPPSLRVLDLGAGTGFASTQVLRAFGDRVTTLVCQDLSPDMLRQCQTRLRPLTGRARFVAGLPGCLRAGEERFDLVTTSAMLHHVVDLPAFLALIAEQVTPGGFYVAGHEPCREFYANAGLYRWTVRYRRWRRLRRALSPRAWAGRFGTPDESVSVERRTNEVLVRRGVIKAPLPPGVIAQLVDIHIPPASRDVPFWGEPGFDPRDLCGRLLPGFELAYVTTYPHVKDARARMGGLWRAIDERLARKYPTAGANFLMAARRTDAHLLPVR
jgi:SAM-dependent methyltransferase